MIISAKDFKQRTELDDYVKNELGDDIPQNRKDGHTIEGTAEELKNLNLSVNTRIYGVKVVLLED